MSRKKNLFQNVEKEKSISKCWERSVKRKPNLNFSRVIKNSYFDQHWTIPEKIQTEGGGGRVWGHRISTEVLKKDHVEILGSNKKVEFPGLFKNNSWNFHGIFLTLEFPRSVTDLAKFSGGKLVFSGISKGY